MHMAILHTIIWIMLDYFYLTKGENGAIIIKLSTRETENERKNAGNLGIREQASE